MKTLWKLWKPIERGVAPVAAKTAMRYDESVFRNHYGRLYTDLAALQVMCLVGIVMICGTLGWDNVDFIGAAILVIDVTLLLPLTGLRYVSAREECRRQRQWIDHNGCLCVKTVPSSSGGMATGERTYVCERIDRTDVTSRYFVISGTIRREDRHNGAAVMTRTGCIRVRRCFEPESTVIALVK